MPPDRTLGAIETSDLKNFLNWLEKGRGIPCSPKSLSRRITSIKSFFRWLQTGGVLIINPAEKVLQRSVISPLPQVLSDEEVSAVLLAADRYRRLAKPDARPFLLAFICYWIPVLRKANAWESISIISPVLLLKVHHFHSLCQSCQSL